MIQLACITVKYQKCGKINCRCYKGYLHGPYYWLIKYKKPTIPMMKGKYNWIYLGKNNNTILNRLRSLGFTKKWDNDQWKTLNEKLNKIELKKNNNEKELIELP